CAVARLGHAARHCEHLRRVASRGPRLCGAPANRPLCGRCPGTTRVAAARGSARPPTSGGDTAADLREPTRHPPAHRRCAGRGSHRWSQYAGCHSRQRARDPHRLSTLGHLRRTTGKPAAHALGITADDACEHRNCHRQLARDPVEYARDRVRPGSRDYRQAYAAATAVAAQPRPDLSSALTLLLRAVDSARSTELAEWPAAAHGAFVAEIEYLRRVVELLPS